MKRKADATASAFCCVQSIKLINYTTNTILISKKTFFLIKKKTSYILVTICFLTKNENH